MNHFGPIIRAIVVSWLWLGVICLVFFLKKGQKSVIAIEAQYLQHYHFHYGIVHDCHQNRGDGVQLTTKMESRWQRNRKVHLVHAVSNVQSKQQKLGMGQWWSSLAMTFVVEKLINYLRAFIHGTSGGIGN
jgi:hypothetical protein